MKYNININQLAFSHLSDVLDIVDAAVLDYVIYLCDSNNDKVNGQRYIDVNGLSWTWVDYQSLIKNMPLLRIDKESTRCISSRLSKLEVEDFIKILKRRVNGHIRIFVMKTCKVDELFVRNNDEEAWGKNSLGGGSLGKKFPGPKEKIPQGGDDGFGLKQGSNEKAWGKNSPNNIYNNNSDNYIKETPLTKELEYDIKINKEAWLKYVNHRKEIGQKLTPMAITRQQNFLKGFSYSEQDIMIEASIRNGWTGIFENTLHQNKNKLRYGERSQTGKYADDDVVVINNNK